MDVAAVRAGMAEALAPLARMTGFDGLKGFQVTGYMLGQPTPPTVQFFPDDVTYDLAGSRGLDEWTWTVQAFVAMNLDRSAQMILDALLAPGGQYSVKHLMEVDPTLGGVVDDLRVTKAGGYLLYAHPGGALVLGSEWTVTFLAGA